MYLLQNNMYSETLIIFIWRAYTHRVALIPLELYAEIMRIRVTQ